MPIASIDPNARRSPAVALAASALSPARVTAGVIDVRTRAAAAGGLPGLLVALALGMWMASTQAHDETRDREAASAPRLEPVRAYPLDRSGRRQVGEASYYDDYFFGRKMANGEPMQPHSNNAASKTLPLGTKAQVKNLENGRTAVVEIKDRGPYIEGRIVDLSPSTAEKLGIIEQGVARVEVKPIALPPGPKAGLDHSPGAAPKSRKVDAANEASAGEASARGGQRLATAEDE